LNHEYGVRSLTPVTAIGTSKFGHNDDFWLQLLHTGLSSCHVGSHVIAFGRENLPMANEQSYLRTIVNQDGAVILNTITGDIATLNATGAFIWQALERGESLERIAADLAGETGEQADSLKRDVREFMAVLKEQRFFSR
jgi:hypothetical protein